MVWYGHKCMVWAGQCAQWLKCRVLCGMYCYKGATWAEAVKLIITKVPRAGKLGTYNYNGVTGGAGRCIQLYSCHRRVGVHTSVVGMLNSFPSKVGVKMIEETKHRGEHVPRSDSLHPRRCGQHEMVWPQQLTPVLSSQLSGTTT